MLDGRALFARLTSFRQAAQAGEEDTIPCYMRLLRYHTSTYIIFTITVYHNKYRTIIIIIILLLFYFIMIRFVIAGSHEHVPWLFPMISDAGVLLPERSFFSMLVNAAVPFEILFNWIRFHQISNSRSYNKNG